MINCKYYSTTYTRLSHQTKLATRMLVAAMVAFLSLNAYADVYSNFNWTSNHTTGNSDNQFQQKQDIKIILQDYVSAWNAGDAASVSQLYTEDAMFFAPGAPPYVGQEDIRALVAALMTSGINRISLAEDETKVCGRNQAAYSIGHYELYSGEVMVGKGPFLMVFESDDEGWRISRDIFNSSISQ